MKGVNYIWTHKENILPFPCYVVYENNLDHVFCYVQPESKLLLVKKQGDDAAIILQEATNVFSFDACEPYIDQWCHALNLTVSHYSIHTETQEEQEARYAREHAKLGNEALQEYLREEQISVSGWVIHSEGDPSVGIFSSTWQLDGNMHFDAREDMEAFRSTLASAFELVCDGPIGITSYEEQKSINAAEETHFDELQS